ncbi:MAG TPA: prepilin-type N-terminal cleavage/methylation domain-containing protein [Desulfobacteria bacterium]|nr:prepilin-type N-terminal cleavage/methylation domain-containing protein [Desulfobacteria bacterium]
MMNLRKYLKRVSKEDAGFTLIELMVVVVILGILGSIVVPRIMTDITGDARDNANTANIKMLQAAVDRYKLETGNSIADWTDTDMATKLEGTEVDGEITYGPWVDDVPEDYVTDENGKVGPEPAPAP